MKKKTNSRSNPRPLRKSRRPSRATLRAFEYSALVLEWCLILTLSSFALMGILRALARVWAN